MYGEGTHPRDDEPHHCISVSRLAFLLTNSESLLWLQTVIHGILEKV